MTCAARTRNASRGPGSSAVLPVCRRLQLPRFSPGFSSFVGSQRTDHRTHVDSVLVDADARRVELTWRAAIPLPRKHEMLDRVNVFEKELV
jgi:hypothetical protein